MEKQVGTYWSNESREAPAVIRWQGKYLFLSSFCTGWAPNQCKYALSDSIAEGFGALRLVGDETTYRSQAAFLMAVDTKDGQKLLYIGDRWGGKGEKYFESTYTWYPLEFGADGKLTMIPAGAFDLRGGELRTKVYPEDAAAYDAAKEKEGTIG